MFCSNLKISSMEDEMGQGSGDGVPESPLSDNLHSETIDENNKGSENQVEDSYEEGDDDGGEIMVEIVGSDVFVDGISGNKDVDLGCAQIGDVDDHISEKEEKESETANISEAMDVSSEGVENKIGVSESGLLKSRDEKHYVVVDEKKTGDSESGDEKSLVFTEAMDVSNVGAENKTGGNELELPESGGERNSIVKEAMDVLGEGAENKTEGNELGLPEAKDERNHVVEAMDVLCEGAENKTGGNELGLPEPKDERNHVVTEAMDVLCEGGENKMRESESGSPKSKDEKELVAREGMDISNEGGESKKGGNELGLPELGIEKNYIVTEATYVLSEGGENMKHENESGLFESKVENNHVVREETDGSLSDPMQCEEAIVSTQMVIREEKIVKDEADDGKTNVTEKQEVVALSDDASNQDHSGSDSLTSHGTTKESHDGQNVPSDVVLNPNGDGQISSVQREEAISTVTTQMVISEEKAVKDEAVDEKAGITEKDEVLPLSGDALNKIVPSDVINPNCEGPENVQVDGIYSVVEKVDLVNANAGGEILDPDTLKDSDCDKEAKFVQEKEGFAAENKDLVVKSSDALASAVQNENEGCVIDSHGAKFECNHENEREKAIGEGFHVVLDFKDRVSDINMPVLSCVGNDEALESDGDLKTNMVCQNHVVSSEQIQQVDGCDNDVLDEDKSLDDEIQADTKETQPTQPEVEDGGELSENGEENVSEMSMQSLECQENAEITNNVEISGLAQNQEQEVSMIITEISDHAIEKLESTNLMPSEVVSVAAVSDITQGSIVPEIAERTELPFDSNNVSLLDGGEIDKEKSKSSEENRESHGNYHDTVEVDSVLGNEQLSSEADTLNLSNEERVKKSNQSGYFSSPGNEGHFAISDLVWGKVRSHLWWPRQLFDPSDASEKAVKYYKNDSYLVAYFGDRTFAWNDSSLLKPFRSHFSQIEKQSNSEGFQDAVISALKEVSRRVELGLTCSCIRKDIYATIEAQNVENTGICEKSCKRYRVDHSTRASYFEPDKLLNYVRELAPRASCGVDRLDLVIAQAQLSTFYRYKGYRPSAIFSSPGELLENDAEKISNDEIIASYKRKHVPENSSESKKERSLTELMGGGEYDNNEDESFGKKQKALDPLMDGYDKRVSIYAAKLSNLTSQTPNKPSFKIGECIRRVASQLTGSMSSGKDEMVIDGSQKMYEQPERRSMVLSIESFSVEEILLQLEGVAQEPRRRHNFINVVHAFFMGYRSSIALNRRGRKKRAEQATAGGASEGFEFDDVSDSYWTDRIVHNCSEDQMLNNHVNGQGTFQLVLFGSEKPMKSGRKTNSRKRFFYQTAADGLDEQVKRRKQETSPAELILNFAERKSIPSEINLNKMFRRFGPLMESETEVDHESGCAKVIFKRGSDAEVARDSSEKFNIFGPVLVNYQIGYEPLISVKVLPLAVPAPLEDMIVMQ